MSLLRFAATRGAAALARPTAALHSAARVSCSGAVTAAAARLSSRNFTAAAARVSPQPQPGAFTHVTHTVTYTYQIPSDTQQQQQQQPTPSVTAAPVSSSFLLEWVAPVALGMAAAAGAWMAIEELCMFFTDEETRKRIAEREAIAKQESQTYFVKLPRWLRP